MKPEASAPNGARRAGGVLEWVGLLALAGLLAWIYLPVIASMVQNWWRDPNYSHGFLVPLVSGYLVWRQRQSLARLAAGPNPWGLAAVSLGLLVWLVGEQAHEFYLRRISLIPVLWGLYLLRWGWPVARRTAFAFLYLLLMVPLPYMLYDAAAFPLRLVAARLAGEGIRLFGVPVLVEGNVLHLPNVILDVVDACSGIRSLISLLAAGVILAYLMLPNRWLKALVVILVPPVAVATNAARVMIAGLLAEWVGPATLEGSMHDAVGWLVFMAAFLLLAGLTLLLKRLAEAWEARHAG
jgi:exosortase